MRLHASCAARDGNGVLLTGPPGAGKSDLLLRLIDRGFRLVSDDQVEITFPQPGALAGPLASPLASPPENLAGLLEVRGLGILRLPYLPIATLRLAVRLGPPERLPNPARHEHLDLPLISVDPRAASAPLLVSLALDAVLGQAGFVPGAFG